MLFLVLQFCGQRGIDFQPSEILFFNFIFFFQILLCIADIAVTQCSQSQVVSYCNTQLFHCRALENWKLLREAISGSRGFYFFFHLKSETKLKSLLNYSSQTLYSYADLLCKTDMKNYMKVNFKSTHYLNSGGQSVNLPKPSSPYGKKLLCNLERNLGLTITVGAEQATLGQWASLIAQPTVNRRG